ncbi:MAG TPA: hypothetical protein VGM44_05160 [Polyangiaceae bacterium]|jgi:hypothetical protein
MTKPVSPPRVLSPPTQAAAVPGHHPHWADDYKRILPQALALDPKELVPLNVNLMDVVALVLGKLPQIIPFREQAAAELPNFKLESFDELGAYAHAAGYAHALWCGTSEPLSKFGAWLDEGTKLRALLLADIAALRLHGLIPADSVGHFDARVGFRKLGFDLMTLALLLRQHWPTIEHKIPLALADLDRACELSERIIGAVSIRKEAPKVRAAAAEQRLRNFTLLVRAYEDVRRAIAFLQPKKGELEQIAPSLYTERKRKRRKPKASVETPPTEVTAHFEPLASAESHALTFASTPRLLQTSSTQAPFTTHPILPATGDPSYGSTDTERMVQ